MSDQNFLANAVDRLKSVIAGDDYLDLDTNKKSGRTITKEGQSRLNRTVRSNGAGGGFRGNNTKYHIPIQTPEVPKPLNPNASARSRARAPVIKPNPFSAPATGRLTGSSMPTARGGILTGLAGIAANQLVEPMSREIVRGTRMLLGDENYNLPAYIKSVDGANYDIRTGSGKDAYLKAKNSSGLSEMDQRALALKNDERIARIKAESDQAIKAGQDDINSVFYKAPTRDKPAPNGGDGNGTQTSPGGKPIVMDMAAADTLYKTLGLGSYSSGAKGYTSTDSSDPVYAKTKNYTEIKPSNPLYAEAFGQDLADSQLKGNTANMSMSDALADTESMRGPETDEGRLMRARAAFLNTKGSMEGLRAQERELDIIYAGGQHYALGDDGAFIKNSAGLNQAADPKEVQQLKSGQLYKEAFKQNLINGTAETPSQGENPFVQSPVPVSFNTESLVDFGSTDILGNNMDMIAGNAFNKSDISPLNEGAFTQDLEVSQYIPGYKREPYMRQLK